MECHLGGDLGQTARTVRLECYLELCGRLGDEVDQAAW